MYKIDGRPQSAQNDHDGKGAEHEYDVRLGGRRERVGRWKIVDGAGHNCDVCFHFVRPAKKQIAHIVWHEYVDDAGILIE